MLEQIGTSRIHTKYAHLFSPILMPYEDICGVSLDINLIDQSFQKNKCKYNKKKKKKKISSIYSLKNSKSLTGNIKL